ncbi:MAG: hypothetical protein ACI4QN_02395, partial [Candidatus Coproplasma sp.]
LIVTSAYYVLLQFMTGVKIMQLLILAAMLMLAGNGGFAQIKPLIEEFGGEEAKTALKQAEELSQIISTVQAVTSPPPQKEENAVQPERPVKFCRPLDPIKSIADERTLAALSKYIAVGE